MVHPHVAECRVQQRLGTYTERMERCFGKDCRSARFRYCNIDFLACFPEYCIGLGQTDRISGGNPLNVSMANFRLSDVKKLFKFFSKILLWTFPVYIF